MRRVLWIGAAVLVGANITAAQRDGRRAETPPAAPSHDIARGGSMPVAAQNELVDTYCATCHSKGGKSGDLSLEGLDLGAPDVSRALLEKMIRKVRAGLMPQPGAERPAAGELAAFVTALETRADALEAAAPDPGRRPPQRLNRAEYAAAVKDLLGLDVDAAAILPADTVSGGFDNIADVQTVSPLVITAYLRAATDISRRATAPDQPPATRRRLLTCVPRTSADDRPCATTILSRVIVPAYRGTNDETDLADALKFYDAGRTTGTFDEGIRRALQSILMSPKFLLRVDRTVPGSPRLDGPSLASRLSFFLWGRPPDAALLAAARRGALSTSAGLADQMRRMLADPRADALATRFAGQWLRLQDLDADEPDPKLFPGFDQDLARAMRRETELFVGNVVRTDDDVMSLLTSNRSFVNERLARHYGLPGVTGPSFRRVVMPEARRGLLGQGSVLTLTSLGNRTSPVLRGKWVLEVLLGTPPPPPPPNVPALDDTAKSIVNGTPRSTRQRMEQHRQSPQCSSCHRVIDPLGLTLENFDAIGAWRVADNDVPVDAIADLYDGRRMDGAAGLRDALLAHQDMFLRNVTEQLMTYALGRRLTFHDMPTVRAIVRDAERRGNRFSAFVAGVVSSDAFQSRGTGS